MNDQFPPPGWSLRPENWMYRLPGTVFGRLPASWAPQLPPMPSSDTSSYTWDQARPLDLRLTRRPVAEFSANLIRRRLIRGLSHQLPRRGTRTRCPTLSSRRLGVWDSGSLPGTR
jgi:hypothetical protein